MAMTPQPSKTKDQVGYEVPAANPETPCGGCCYFLGGNCEIVLGPIEPYAWCQEWRAP